MAGEPILVFGLLIGAAVLLLAFYRPEIGLMMLIFLIYSRFSDVTIQYVGLPSTAKPFIAFMVFVVVARLLLFNERPFGWERSAAIVVLYGLLGAFSLLYAPDLVATTEALNDFVKDALIVLIIVILIRDDESLRMAIWTLLLVGIFLGTLSIYQQLTATFENPYWGFAQAPLMHIIGEENAHRIGGPMGSPNAFGQVMIPLVPLALSRLWNEKKPFFKFLALWALAATVLTVIFTFSRTGFLAMSVTLALSLWYHPPRLSSWLMLILLAAVVVEFLPDQYINRVSTLTAFVPGLGNGNEIREEVSFKGRLSENLAGWYMFQDNPIVGVGWANFPEHYLEYSRTLGVDDRRVERGAHNTYLQVAAEQGLVGLAIFGGILLTVFVSLKRAKEIFNRLGKVQNAAIAESFQIALIGYFTAAIFIHMAYPRYFWLLLGLALSIHQLAKRQERQRMLERAR